jgi:hypothetical protein
MGLRPFINSSLARKQDERSLPVYYPYIGEGEMAWSSCGGFFTC